jgi:two-component system response regulator DegU
MVVDDRAMPRIAAKAMLSSIAGVTFVGEATSGAEALKIAARLKPDIVLMDVDMSDMDGPQATTELLGAYPATKVLAWTVSDTSDDLLRMIHAGCAGYVLKDVGPEELHRAIIAAVRQEMPIPRRMMPDVLRRAADQTPSDSGFEVSLTTRELETLRWMAKGLPVKSIARKMQISPASVDTHLRNVYRKLGVNNRGEAVNIALKQGVVKLSDL